MSLTAVLIFLGITTHFALATSQSSSVYHCIFVDENTYTLRMKEYFDAEQNTTLGKVDLMQDLEAQESFPVKVYRIPLADNQNYMQLWRSAEVRVDAQFSSSSPNLYFRAIFSRGDAKWKLNCEKRSY